MTFEIALLLFIILATIVLFSTEIYRVDTIAISVMVILMLTGLVTPEQGISGFSNTATLTVFAMLVLSASVNYTGLVRKIGENLQKYSGKKEWQIILSQSFTVGLVSSFVNTTAAVSIFVPIVNKIASDNRISRKRLLMPLSFAGMVAGTITTIGTSTNIIVSSISESHGYGAFSLFEFTKIGLSFFVLFLLYFIFIGRHLLPSDISDDDLDGDIDPLHSYFSEIRVRKHSSLIGKRLIDSNLKKKLKSSVVKIIKPNGEIDHPHPEYIFNNVDKLELRGDMQYLIECSNEMGISILTSRSGDEIELQQEDNIFVQVVVSPHSRLVGRSIQGFNFYKNFKAYAFGMRRKGLELATDFTQEELKIGDVIIATSTQDQLGVLKQSPDFVSVTKLSNHYNVKSRIIISGLILLGVILLAAFNILPILISALTGSLLMILLKCIPIDTVYKNVDWKIVFLLAGLLPLGIAMENTGTSNLIGNFIVDVIGNQSERVIVSVLFLMTVVITSIMSNNATAILLAPIAISISAKLGYDPKLFLAAIMFAATTSFFTPIGYQTNAIVYSAGGYKFSDFVKTGGILTVLFWIAASLIIPFFIS